MEVHWRKLFESEFEKEYFIDLKRKLHKCKSISPPIEFVFNFTNFISFNNIKVVIIGQDSYHTKNEANGIAFSSNSGKIPYSLSTIFRAIKNDYPSNDTLSTNSIFSWMNQGVLLLNSSLTVETGKAGSHTHLNWNCFISSILFKLKQSPNIVYILWGLEAAKHSKFIDNKNNLVHILVTIQLKSLLHNDIL
ncbi:UNG [Hepatospora eriocheir]|uniref:UNG n=1 Tax=Hepatospora eriocheir TaxID=1081669 RepID=A0A1X0Q5F5_9MICR|nr:UNG [Hepatospora eriocheir]